MLSRIDIQHLVYSAIDRVNAHLPADKRLASNEDTYLIHPDSGLDSLGLISFIVNLEEILVGTHGISIELTEEIEPLIQDVRSLTLADFIVLLESRLSDV